ncbi:unnamed protein product, partial [Staurois parvus]
PVIICQLCNKFIRELSLLLNIPWSTDSGIITKWKQLGTIATRPHKMTEQGQRSVQKSPNVYRVNNYRPPNFVWPSD